LKVNIQSLNIHYEVAGQGKPLVLLHGLGCDTKIFKALNAHFQQYFTVYRLDFPGFGQSDVPPNPWTNDDYVDFTKAFLEKLQIENPIILGHSFGGRIALKLGTLTPFHKLILTGSAGIKPSRSLSYYTSVYTYKFLKILANLPILSFFLAPLVEAYIQNMGSEDYKKSNPIMRTTLSNVVNADLTPYMPKLAMPVLLLWGENDTATPVKNAKIMENLIPDAGLVVLKNSGHYVFLEQAQQFTVIMDKFLEKDR